MYTPTGAIEASRGLGIADAFARDRRIDSDLEKVKVTNPGPPAITVLIERREAARAVWLRMVGLIRREIRQLIA